MIRQGRDKKGLMRYRDVKINEFYKTVRDGVCRVYAKNNPDLVDNRGGF